MEKNFFLSDGTKSSIDKIVSKIHRDIDYQNSVIDLSEVRELLRLDLKYYSSENDSYLSEVIHKFYVGGQRVLENPALLKDVVTKMSLKALFLPDRRRIMLDASLHKSKHRWNESHEIIHSVLPWHDSLMYGDHIGTLSKGCNIQLEAEANYGGGELLFPRKTFLEVVSSFELSMTAARKISSQMGNSLTSTVWRIVESCDQVLLGIIGPHPQYLHLAPEKEPIRYLIRSKAALNTFGTLSSEALISAMQSYCAHKTRGPLGDGVCVLADDLGADHLFRFDSFSNTHEVLTLAVHLGERSKSVVVASDVEVAV